MGSKFPQENGPNNIDGQIVKLRLTVAEIRRIIDRFDNDGIPFYLVTAGPTVMVNPSPDGLQP